MSSHNRTPKSGEYNALCDICGFKKKNWQLRKRWDGAMVCPEDWEPRHPLDFYRTRVDVHELPFIRSDNNGIDISPFGNPEPPTTPGWCNVVTIQPKTDVALADCAQLTI